MLSISMGYHHFNSLSLKVIDLKTQRKIEFKLKLLSTYSDYKRMVDLLVANGANVNHIDNEGKSVLHWAAAKGKCPTIRILYISEYSYPIRRFFFIFLASDTIADTLIKSGARSVSVQDKVGKTPLYYATLTGHST